MNAQKKQILKQHFTDAKEINNLMCELLGSVEGLSVLEPCVGHGAFLQGLQGSPQKIVAVDIDPMMLSVAKQKYSGLNIEFFCSDFIDIFTRNLFQEDHYITRQKYDAVISNPPYGLYLDIEYRKKLKKAFPHLYVRESFGLFFAFSISLLQPSGRYVFLVPDTFLASKNHTPLRNFICSQAAPTQIIRFPSKKFETVNFGYGNLCIIAGEHRPLGHQEKVRWLDVFEPTGSLTLSDVEDAPTISGDALWEHREGGWSKATLSNSNQPLIGWTTLGELAECRTGIYTGDNERFIGYDPARITRRLNGHSIDWLQSVCLRPLTALEKQKGIEDEQHYVPLIRGGHRPPFEKTPWAINWSPDAINFYLSNRKARFQNSQFYFRAGLSVPMVTTKRISAALMSGAVFDQGVVGVFPHSSAMIPALLIYLNSALASDNMKRLTNGSANNSANYLKRLPVPIFSQTDIDDAADILKEAKHKGEFAEGVFSNFVEKIAAKATKSDNQLNRLVAFSDTERTHSKDRYANL